MYLFYMNYFKCEHYF